MASLTIIDWAILAVVVISAVTAFSQGFFREVFSLLGLVLGLVLACWNYALLAHVFFRWISSTNIANALAFLLIALGVMLVAGMVGGLLRKVVHGVGLGWMDRLMGAVFGVLRGCLLVTVAIIAVLAFRPGALWMHQSTLVPYFLPGARVLSAQAPRELKEKIIWGANLLKHSRVTWVQ